MVLKFRKALLIIFSISLFFGGTSKKSEAYEYFMKGEYELLQNDFKMAEKYYKKALFLSPDSPTILNSLVDLKTYQGKYSEAINYLERNIKLDPNNKEIGLNLYELYSQEGINTKAELLLDSLLIYFPGDMDILFARANTQFSAQNWIDLLKTYQDIYKADPHQNEILIKIYEIGVATGNIELVRDILWELKSISQSQLILELLIEIADSSGEYSEAISLMYELMETTGSTDNQLINLSQLHLRIEKFDGVVDILSPIYEKGNHSLDVLRMLLIAYSSLGQIENEINVSKTLMNEYPDIPVGYEALSFAYLQAGSNEKAVEILLQALPKFPDEVTFPFSLATIFYNSGDYLKAENYFHRALTIQPDLVAAKHSLALMYEDMDDTSRSDSLFLHMINQNENDAGGRNDYAYILSERKNSSKEDFNYALQLAERAVAMEPENAAFLDTIGWIYYKLETYQKAEEFIEKSLNYNEDNPVILEHLGDIYVKMNKTIEAINIYEKLLEKDSDNQLIRNKLDKIND